MIFLDVQQHREVERFENLRLDEIITPVNPDILEEYLKMTNYDEEESTFLVSGFRNGFDIGYEGPQERQDFSANILFKKGIGSKEDMWEKIMTEVKNKRVSGPFEQPQTHNFIQSRLGLVPKSNDRTRLIFHLSFDFKVLKSVNACTPKNKCSVKYEDLDRAVNLTLGFGMSPVFYGKTDLSNAFRILPLNLMSRRWTWMACEDPETGETVFFQENCLPFGSSISCSHFQRFSRALKHILESFLVNSDVKLVVYLDDFLYISPEREVCNEAINIFVQICNKLGIKIMEEKTEFASTEVVFWAYS